MRTIESAGVEIREFDNSFNTQLPVGTTIFAVGYAPQGPTDELVNVTAISEFEQIYGLPTNAAERYFYNTVKQILEANSTLMVTRLPYGSGSGDGYTQNYSALVFPVFPYSSDYTDYTVAASGTGYKAITPLYTFTVANTDGNLTITSATNYYSYLSSAAVEFIGDFRFDDSAINNPAFSLTYATSTTGPAETVNFDYVSATGVLSADVNGFAGTLVLTEIDLDAITYTWGITTTLGTPITAGALTTNVSYTAGALTGISDLTDSDHYYLGQPYHVVIDEVTYFQWRQGGINWKDVLGTSKTSAEIYATSGVGYAGMVVVNKLKTAIDDQFAGYYIAIADNSKIDKGTNFDSIANIKTLNNATNSDEWLTLNSERLGFALTGTYTQDQGSISEIVESIPGYDFSSVGAGGYTDSIIFTIFRVRPSIYNADTRTLDNVLLESFIGSFDSTRTINNPRGGNALNFFLQDIVNGGSNTVEMFINPFISTQGGPWWDSQTGLPLKSIRVMADGRTNDDSSIATDPAQPYGDAKVKFDSASADTYMSNGDNLNGIGEFVSCVLANQKLVGNMPLKLERALMLAENRELIRVDIVPEGGLGTVWTGMKLDMDNYPSGTTSSSTDQTNQEFDDTKYVEGILEAHTFDADSAGLLDQVTGAASEANDLYETIYNVFNSFCETTRKDCLYIADPLRYIFVQGNGDVKVLDDRTKNFSQHMFWPLKNLFGAANSSYACTYANWFKANDKVSSKLVWLPPSGFVANIMVKVDTNQFPWYAPAGLNRGIIRNIVDIGVNPSQRQRDLLYKNGINPTVYWPGDGYVVWGQKTLLTKPSAFDRINVRRLFLWLEKATLQLTRWFVFEQNTVFTRERLKTALTPIFEFAKNNEGIYDYLIVCDERNNLPEVIDRNELVVDIYIKPVRAAEFILVNFYATRTGQDFSELI